jgi:uncharacterized repeat protein (TIGR01451 family)
MAQTIFSKDPAAGNSGVYTVSGLTGIGGIDWDFDHDVLWVCNLSAYTGLNRRLASDVGYVRFNLSGVGVFTHVATAAHGCVNGIDYNPASHVLSASGGKLSSSTQLVDRIVVNDDLTAGLATTFPSTPITSDGYLAGTQSMTGSLYFADNFGGTKTVQYTTDMVSSTLVASSTSRRYEDLACDPFTFAPTTVVWVEWFDHNEIVPIPTRVGDTCLWAPPPPPVLQISQTATTGVVADSLLTYQVSVANPTSTPQTNVDVSDTPPANTIMQSVTATQGTCSGTIAVSCELGGLAAGASATVTVTLVPVQPGTATNAAAAVSDQAAQVSSSKSATVAADPAVVYSSVSDTGFTPSAPLITLGKIVQYNALGSVTHSISETTLQLFTLSPLVPISYARHEFDAAGGYTVVDSATGATQAVKVRLAAPSSATLGTPFTVTWSATSIPAGFDEDVQVQLPGATTWANWLTNQTASSGTYTAAAAGTYRFRARVQRTGGAASLYSPAFSVAVS